MKYTAAVVAASLCTIIGLAALRVTQAAERETKEIQGAIEKANESFMEAFRQGDAEALAAMYTADAMLLPPQQRSVEGRDAIQAFWEGVTETGANAFILRTMEAERHGDTAHEVGTYVMIDENEKTMDSGKYIVIWKQADGAWKLHRDIWNTSISPGGA